MCRVLQRHGWMVCYAFMLAFFLVMVPSLAYADTYVATGDSAVRAAMVYLGYDPEEGESTNKLVTAFYDATNGDEYTGWQSFVNGLYQPLGTVNYNEQWWSPADGFMFSNQVDRARSDAVKIYEAWKSESEESGGTPQVTEIVTLETMYAGTWSPTSGTQRCMGTVGVDGSDVNVSWGVNGSPLAPSSITVNVSQNTVEYINGILSDNAGYAAYFVLGNENGTFNGATNGKYSIKILIANQNDVSIGANTAYENFGLELNTNLPYYNVNAATYGRINNGVYSKTIDTTNIPITESSANVYIKGNAVCFALASFGASGTAPTPPEPEPEPPTPPEPPRDPEPPTPDPTQPSQTIDLQGIIDRLDIIIRNQVVLINWLDDAFASVNQNIQWLGELIDESFGWLWEVLDNLQSSIDSGINRITTWLEMIYRKIGGQGGTVSRPNIDTPTPWDDFLSWLEGILQRLLDLIFGVTPAALQNLLSGLADLTTKFPFSIPWDLAGLITLFVHEPVTPVFDLPLYMPFAGNIVNFHIDLSTWDDVMQIARDGEVILFAAWLIMATPDFYRHLNSVTGSD